jgi:hypothetical protein
MSTLKVNEIEDYDAGTVTIKNNTIIDGSNNLNVGGATTLSGAVVCSNTLTATSAASAFGAVTAAGLVTPNAGVTMGSSQTLNMNGGAISNCGVGVMDSAVITGTLTVGGVNLAQYLKAFGHYEVATPGTDAGTVAPVTGSLNVGSAAYEFDDADRSVFSVPFSSALDDANYVVIPVFSTTYTSWYRTLITNKADSGFDVEFLSDGATAMSDTPYLHLHFAVLHL